MEASKFSIITSGFNLTRLKTATLLVLPLGIFVSVLFSEPHIKLSTQIWDEKLRQYSWFLAEKENRDSNFGIAVLDLYTSESFNASPSYYDERYKAYNLPSALDVFCKLGVQRVALDFFVDPSTWLGKHLLRDEGASQAIYRVLSCFEEVWVPVRSEAGHWILPIEPIADLQSVRFSHVNTLESVLYQPLETNTIDKGKLTVPYMAEALAKNEFDENGLRPILPSVALSAFPRMRFEDLQIFQPLMESMDTKAFGEFYRRYFEDDVGKHALPKLLVVGFSHDAQDQHDVAYNKGGPIDLPRVGGLTKMDTGPAQGRAAYGQEPAVPFTPGMYVLAATTQSLASSKPYRYITVLNVGYLSVVLVVLVLLAYFSIQFSRSWQIALFFFATTIGYLLLGFLGVAKLNMLLPIVYPVALIFGLWLIVELRYGSGLLSQLGQLLNLRYAQSNSSTNTAEKPIIIEMAESIRDSHVDPYKKLISTIDILTYWIQILALLSLAEYFEQGSNRGKKLNKKNWNKWKRPTLGNYLHLFKDINNTYANLKEVTDHSRFPQLYILMHSGKKASFAAALFRIIDVRNDWKHFSSTAYTDAQIRAAMDELHDLESFISNRLGFLNEFVFIKTKKFNAEENGTYYWDCLVFSGPATYLEEFATVDSLKLDTLYLFEVRKWGKHKNTLCLEPWFFAGECKHHHREELFFFSGLLNDEKTRRISKRIKYSGLTEGCIPSEEGSVDDILFQLISKN